MVDVSVVLFCSPAQRSSHRWIVVVLVHLQEREGASKSKKAANSLHETRSATEVQTLLLGSQKDLSLLAN